MTTDEPPQAPKAAASAAIFQGETVLLVKRGKPPLAGLWSLPGGHIEFGEPARMAALREVEEETGVTARIDGLVQVHDVINTPGGRVGAHYVIAVYHGQWLAGVPQAASDAAEARFVPFKELSQLSMTAEAEKLIARAWACAQKGMQS